MNTKPDLLGRWAQAGRRPLQSAVTGWVAVGAHTAVGAAALTAADGLRRHLPDTGAGALMAATGVIALYGTRYTLQAADGLRGVREHWIRRHQPVALIIITTVTAAGALAALGCGTGRLANTLLAGLLGFAYCFPIPGGAWRRIGPAKPVILALAWTLVTAPWLGGNPTTSGTRFIVLLGMALLFDLKDMEKDRAEGILTPAARWGAKSVRMVATLLFVAATGINLATSREAGALESMILGTICLLGTRGSGITRTTLLGDGAMIVAGAAGILTHFYQS